MSTQKITELLEQLAEIEDEANKYAADRAAHVRDTLEPVQIVLDSITAFYEPLLAQCTAKGAALRAEIETLVKEQQTTVKGGHWQVVYNKPAVTWDGKKLEGMMLMVPQLAGARKVGEPKVAWRQVKA